MKGVFPGLGFRVQGFRVVLVVNLGIPFRVSCRVFRGSLKVSFLVCFFWASFRVNKGVPLIKGFFRGGFWDLCHTCGV